MKKKKIVHLQLLPLLSGVQNVTLQELERLDDNCYDKYIICKERGPLCFAANKINAEVFFCKNLCRNIHPVKDILSFFSLYFLFKKNSFDIVHTHSAKTGFVGRIAAKLAGVKIIVHTVHGFPFDSTSSTLVKKIYVLLEKIAAKCSTHIVCLHNADRDICINQLGINPKKIKVIPNGVDIARFTPLHENDKKNLREKNNFSKNSLVFIMVGRLWIQKNPIVYIKAAIKIIEEKKYPEIKFLLVGDGELKTEIESLIKGYETQIVMLGWQNNVSDYLKLSDVFVLPSLWEGMPLATLEAQAVGLPCLVSNVTGNLSTVSDGVEGYTFPPTQAEALKLLMLKMIDSKLREKLSMSARQKIIKQHNIRDRINLIEELYK